MFGGDLSGANRTVYNAVDTGLALATVNFSALGVPSDYQTTLKWGMSKGSMAPSKFNEGISEWYSNVPDHTLKFFTNTHIQLANTSANFVRYEISIAGQTVKYEFNRNYVLHIASSNSVSVKTIYS